MTRAKINAGYWAFHALKQGLLYGVNYGKQDRASILYRTHA